MPHKYSVAIPDIEFWKNLVPCQIGCPIHTDAGRYVQLIAGQQYQSAYLTARSPNPFASVCGRVCAAPCEDACRRGKIDAPVSIRALKRFITEKFGVESLEPDTQDSLFERTSEPGNKWTLIFAIVFSALVVGVSYFGMMAEGYSGMQNFTRTSASLLNLILYVVPLVSLVMGTLAFTGDKGSIELLFSQPITRREVVLGKILGVFASISLSTLFGFSMGGMIILSSAGADGLVRYLFLVATSLILSLVFLNLSVLACTAVARKVKAYGFSLFLWFFFVLFYDLLVLGGTLLLSGRSSDIFLFLSLFGNPVDMVRVSTLIVLNNVTIFGAAGAVLIRFLGGGGLSMAMLVAGLLLWSLVPTLISNRLLGRQDI